ncbi:hypothetical protein ACFE04_024983 [Oxalis oulophora]
MAAVTASLERLLQNCSLNNNNNNNNNNNDNDHRRGGLGGGGVAGRSDNTSDTILDLNSNVSLPYHWEQCLDLKTGEIYYINWRNGMKATGDPRRLSEYYYSEEEEEEEEDDDSSYDDSDQESSSESSPSSTRYQSTNTTTDKHNNNGEQQQQVLVVAGCKSCHMYVMVPKQAEDCPKCSGQLLHFERSTNSVGAGGGGGPP